MGLGVSLHGSNSEPLMSALGQKSHCLDQTGCPLYPQKRTLQNNALLPTGETMPTIKPALHHVTMKTSHLDEMIAWYALLIGAQVQFRDQVAAWMTNDDANHRIAFLAVPGLSDDAEKVRHNGMHHCAFEYGSFADLMSSFDRLRAADSPHSPLRPAL